MRGCLDEEVTEPRSPFSPALLLVYPRYPHSCAATPARNGAGLLIEVAIPMVPMPTWKASLWPDACYAAAPRQFGLGVGSHDRNLGG